MAILNLNLANVKPDEGRVGPVPSDWYKAVADQSEIKPTKNGDGAYLSVRFTIIEGPFQGRKVFTNFNLKNPNPQAVEIGYAQLSAFAHAVNVLNVGDSQELHNLPLKIKVKVREARDGYEAQNEITAYKPQNYVDGSSGSAPAAGGYPGAQQGYNAAPPPAQGGYQQTPPQQAPQQAPQGYQQQAPQQGYQQAPVQQQAPQQAGQQPWQAGGAPQQPWEAQGQQQAPVQQQAPQGGYQQQQPPVQQQAPQQGYQQQPQPQQAPVQQEQYNPAATQAQQASPPWQA